MMRSLGCPVRRFGIGKMVAATRVDYEHYVVHPFDVVAHMCLAGFELLERLKKHAAESEEGNTLEAKIL